MSIVARGLGRRGTAAAMLVTAGLGLALALTPVATAVVGGARGGWHVEGDLASQVTRGERGSGGWWGYVAPKVHVPDAVPRATAVSQPAAAPAGRRAPTEEQALLLTLLHADSAGTPVLGRGELALLQALALADRRAHVHHAPPVRRGLTDDEAALIATVMLVEQARLDGDKT